MTRSLTAGPARVVLLCLATMVTAYTASAGNSLEDQAGHVPHPGVVRVRGADERARSLLQEGASRSETFRGLLEAIDRSDLVVYVQTGSLDRPGALLFVCASEGVRFLRIVVRAAGRPDDEVIAWLGHELQHAVEIATAPDVRDDDGVRRLYGRIGFTSRSTCETEAAEQVWARVIAEVRYGARTHQR